MTAFSGVSRSHVVEGVCALHFQRGKKRRIQFTPNLFRHYAKVGVVKKAVNQNDRLVFCKKFIQKGDKSGLDFRAFLFAFFFRKVG